MKIIRVPGNYFGAKADVKIWRDDNVVAIYDKLPLEHAELFEKAEEAINDMDIWFWDKIRSCQNKEAKKILKEIAEEFKEIYLEEINESNTSD